MHNAAFSFSCYISLVLEEESIADSSAYRVNSSVDTDDLQKKRLTLKKSNEKAFRHVKNTEPKTQRL